MMKFLRLSQVRFFTIIMAVAVLLIIAVAITIMLTTIRMSEDFFIRTHTVQNTHVMEQIRRNLDSFHHSVVMTNFQIQQSMAVEDIFLLDYTPTQRWDRLFTLSRTMDIVLANMGAYAVSITIAGSGGDFIFNTNASHWAIKPGEVAADSLMVNTSLTPRNIVYLPNMRHDGASEVPYILIANSLINRDTHFANSLIAIRNSDFAGLFAIHARDGNHMFITDETGTIISSDMDMMIGSSMPEFVNIIYAHSADTLYHEKIIDGRRQIVMAEFLPTQNLWLFNMIDRSLVVYGVIDTRTIFLTVLGIIVASIGIMYVGIKTITNRLSSLTSEIMQVPNTDFKGYVTTSGFREVQDIVFAFNSMLDKLHTHIDEIMRINKQKREAELTGLQRQINIHFLYNTLTSINLLVANGHFDGAVETINDLISLLQFTVGDISETTSVINEVDHLKKYVHIMQRRHGEDILVNFYVDAETNYLPMPKLLIQPFIENAFIHAFQANKQGNIDLFIWKDDNQLVCEIIDNGKGFDVVNSSEERKQKYTGLGIKNVQERMQLLYGEGYGAQIHSQPAEGTKITIRFPYVQK